MALNDKRSFLSKMTINKPTEEQEKAEQRTNDRQLVTGWRATVFGAQTITLGQAEVENSSSGGVSLVVNGTAYLLNQDVTLTVSIEAQNQRFTRKARVCWVQAIEGVTHFGVQYIDHAVIDCSEHLLNLEDVRIDPACLLKLPSNIALRQKTLPFMAANHITHIACATPVSHATSKLLERFFKSELKFWVTNEAQLEAKLKQVYSNQPGGQQALPSAVINDGNRQGAVNLGEDLLYAAYMRQASDIHIDPNYEGATIRFRTDGQLELYNNITTHVYTELVSRLKVMSGLDIAEKRSPQDGRFAHQFKTGARRTDVRVATLPTKYGERLTMRLLAVQTESLTLDNLGFEPEHQRKVERFLLRSQGMMIMTGPTGSGKTTTLYAAIRMLLAERNVNIITIEDPIEYEISGVAQCEVDDGNRLSFAKALRSILRHDPDVVMIGEIRDKETADIAIKAALTGHMVLGTLHTNSAAATVTRLLDMGVESYLVAAALRVAVAQRLLRRLCKYCRSARPMTEIEAITVGHPELVRKTIYDACGCIYCGNKGFSGRIGLYEMLELNEEWARSITEGKGEIELVRNMREAGVKSLLDDAVAKLLLGETAMSEVIQIASSW